MNRSYRTIWNESLGAWVAASEVSATRGKKSSSRKVAAVATYVLASAVLVGGGVTPTIAEADTSIYPQGTCYYNGTVPKPQIFNCDIYSTNGTGVARISGVPADASGDPSIAYLNNWLSTNLGAGSIVIGDVNSSATGANAIAFGNGAQASGSTAIAVGESSLADSGGNVAIGRYSGNYSTPQGPSTSQSNNTSVGFYSGYDVSGRSNSAFGAWSGNDVKGDLNTAVGDNSGSRVNGSINQAVGSFSGGNIVGDRNVSMGYYAGGNSTGSYNVSIGSYSGARGGFQSGKANYSVNIGAGAGANASEATLVDDIGTGTPFAFERMDLVFSPQNGWKGPKYSELANGLSSGAYNVDSGNIVRTSDGVVVGTTAEFSVYALQSFQASGERSISIGRISWGRGEDSIAIGNVAFAGKANAIAMGSYSQAWGDSSIAIGRESIATGSVALGAVAKAGNGGTAIGDGAVATYLNGTTVSSTIAGTAVARMPRRM